MQTTISKDPTCTAAFRIGKVTRETYDTFTLELEPSGGAAEFKFAPGQFNMLYCQGMGEVPISISGDPTKPGILIHTIRAVGTVTRAMDKLKKGDMLGVRGPFGAPWPVDLARGRDVVIIAGGIGLAPLRPAIYQVLASRKDFGKAVLLYGARSPQDMLYPGEYKRWESRGSFDIHVTVDRGTSEWTGNVGVVTTIISNAAFDPARAVAMICGPEIMMRFVVQELLRRGMSRDNIFVSMERNMKCGIGVCGHCQYGPFFICKDGPVFRYDRIEPLFVKREI